MGQQGTSQSPNPSTQEERLNSYLDSLNSEQRARHDELVKAAALRLGPAVSTLPPPTETEAPANLPPKSQAGVASAEGVVDPAISIETREVRDDGDLQCEDSQRMAISKESSRRTE